MKQMNCATHRRGSDHLLPLDPDEYRWPYNASKGTPLAE
jgi:hypothetical protein